MGVAAAGLLVIAVFLAGAFMTYRTTLSGKMLVNEAASASSQMVGERTRTAIDITSATGDGACNLTVDVDNTGATSIIEFAQMDLIAQFPSANNAPQSMIFTEAVLPGLDEWAVTSITGAYEPGIFNPGETMTLEAKISLVEASGGTLTVGTPNGIVHTASFPALSPC